MSARVLATSTRTFELAVEEARLRILRLAKAQAFGSDVLVAAMAEVLGLTAATLDARQGAQPFDERVDAFVEQARSAHQRILRLMATTAAR